MKAIGKLIGGLFKLAMLPFKLVCAVTSLTSRIAWKATLLPARACRATTRLVGFRGILFGLIGLAVGLLLTPMTGRELRDKLRALAAGGGTITDDELVDKVAFELSHAPRTWHIEPQPNVSVIAGRVVLTGEVRDDEARDEFGRVAAAIPGVTDVDNRLEVGTGDTGDEQATPGPTETEPASESAPE